MTDNNADTDRASFYGTLAPGWEFYRRPGARLTEDKHPALLRSDAAVPDIQHEAWHQFDKAHLVMLAENNVIPQSAAVANLKGLREMETAGLIETRRELGHLAHSGEAYLISTLGEKIAGWIHVGRSSVDLGAVGRRILLRDRLLKIIDQVIDVVEAHCTIASTYADAPMPTYTRERHSQVGTFGFYVIAWSLPLQRSIKRLFQAYAEVNQSPAGSAAGTTTNFPIERERTAALLGFDGIHEHALDATRGDVDLSLNILTELISIMGSVSLAADRLVTWGGSEYQLVDLPDRFFSTSSILTHKTNPRVLRNVQGGLNTILSTLGSSLTGYGYSGGHSVRLNAQIFDSIVANLELWEEALQTVEFDRTRGTDLVLNGWGLAPDLAAQMVRTAGINWRWAHQITAILVRESIEAGKSIQSVTVEDVNRAANTYLGESIDIEQSEIDTVIDPGRAVSERAHVQGSPAPTQVTTQIQNSRTVLQSTGETLENLRSDLSSADKKLETAIDTIIESAD